MSADTMFFTEHSIESAPPAARRFMTATRNHLGYLPAGMARMAASPQLMDGFLRLTAIFENTTLEPVAREVVVMTMATRNRCHICVAMHTARLTALGADPGLIEALRDPDRAEPLPDERLDAVRVFALRVLDTAGDVGDHALQDFMAAGYTTQNALEVVLGIGTYTMSTLANRLTGAPVDDQLAAYAWALSCSMTQNDGEARVSLVHDAHDARGFPDLPGQVQPADHRGIPGLPARRRRPGRHDHHRLDHPGRGGQGQPT
jgi:AhpD family alkylhydroperoxidase